MGILSTSQTNRIKLPAVIYPRYFSDSFCDSLIAEVKSQTLSVNNMAGEAGKLSTFATLTKATHPSTYARFWHLVCKANAQNFNYDITAPEDEAYVNKYSAASDKESVDGKEDDHRGWHVDGVLSDGDPRYLSRKLSLVVQLSDPATYKGGDLQFVSYHQPKPDSGYLDRGTVIVFPAFNWHRVTPVTQGIRYSVAFFTHGPEFR